jgi:hypothetical protein
MKRPAYQHYPGDWRNNAKLRRCSWGARGVWVDVLGLMHDSDEYGILRWPFKQIVTAVGCPLPLMRELVVNAVLKGHDKELVDPYVYAPYHAGKRGPEVILVPKQRGPIWFSSRMVRDEYNRTKRGMGTRFGVPPDPSPIPPFGVPPKPGQVDGASASSSSSIDTSVEPRGSAREAVDKSNPGHKNGHESQGQRLASIAAWMTDDRACDAKAQALGIKANPGESYAQLRNKISRAEAGPRR